MANRQPTRTFALIPYRNSHLTLKPYISSPPRAIAAPGFTPVGGAIQGATNPLGGADPSSSTSASQLAPNGTAPGAIPSLAVGAHTGGVGVATGPIGALPSALPARPNLPDDPVIPHNGFQTVEEGEKAFTHLLRKAGVDANWTWDQTMRAIITDPLYKALNTLAEKKACWEKVRSRCIYSSHFTHQIFSSILRI